MGDIIYVDRGAYKHYGIYAGEGNVIHYTKNGTNDYRNGEIRETPLEMFAQKDVLYRIPFPDTTDAAVPQQKTDLAETAIAEGSAESAEPTPEEMEFFELLHKAWGQAMLPRGKMPKIYSPQETVARARSKIGTKGYHLMFSNCEHFAIWCKTGIFESTQMHGPWNILASASVFLKWNLSKKLSRIRR